MLTVSGQTSWKRAFIQTGRRMHRGANVISICPILMAMSFHLLVRSSLTRIFMQNGPEILGPASKRYLAGKSEAGARFYNGFFASNGPSVRPDRGTGFKSWPCVQPGDRSSRSLPEPGQNMLEPAGEHLSAVESQFDRPRQAAVRRKTWVKRSSNAPHKTTDARREPHKKQILDSALRSIGRALGF